MTARSQIGPFGIVPAWVIESSISDRALRLYALLACWADRRGKADTATALRSTIADALACTTRSVDRATKELTDLGAIEIVANFRGHERQANSYVVIAVDPSDTRVATPVTHVSLRDDAAVATSRHVCRSKQEPLYQEPHEQEHARSRRRSPSKDYTPTDDHRAYATEHHLDLDAELEHWLLWCEANARTYASLNAGFSTWLRQAVKYGRGQQQQHDGGRRRVDPTNL